MSGIPPGIQIIGAGFLPQGLSDGEKAPNTIGCVAFNRFGAGTGRWEINVNDPTALPTNCLLILSAGDGSNLDGGESFGLSQSQTINGVTQFNFRPNRVDTQTPADLPTGFIIIKWPLGGQAD